MKPLITFFLLITTTALYAQGSKLDWANATESDEGPGIVFIYNRSMTTDPAGNVYATGDFNGTVDFDPGPSVAAATATAEYSSFVSKMDAAGNFVWVKTLQGRNTGTSITVDAAGNIYSTGYFYGTVDFDPGVGVYNLVSHIDTTLEKNFSNLFISKLDASGNFLWAKTLGTEINISNSCYSSRLVTDAIGNVYTVGAFSGKFDFDPGAGTFFMNTNTTYVDSYNFILKLNTDGNFVWAKYLEGKADGNLSIAVDGSRQVYMAAVITSTVDADPGPGVVTISAKNKDAFVLKLTEAGEFIWAKSMAGSKKSISNASSITIDAAENIYFTGTISGSDSIDMDPSTDVLPFFPKGKNDAFISKLDQSGKLLWAKQLKASMLTEDVSCSSVTVDNAANVYTIGLANGHIDFDPDTMITATLQLPIPMTSFVLKLDANGNFVIVKRVAETTMCYPSGLAVDALQNVYTSGIFSGGSIDFDPRTNEVSNITSHGFASSFVQKMKPCTMSYGFIAREGCFSYSLNDQTYTKSGTYKQMLTNTAGCDSILTLNLTLINKLAICVVTVDSISKHNIIVWEKPVSTLIDSFVIYRADRLSTLFQPIAKVAYNSINKYVDTVANPNVAAYKYKLSILTKCNITDTLTIFHQPIHLVKDYEALLFNAYAIENTEGPGLFYQIYRDAFNTGDFQPLDKVSKYDRVYNIPNDANYPNARYVMDVNWDFTCKPSGMLSNSRSNIVDNIHTGILSESQSDNILVMYPNPTRETITIDILEAIGNSQLKIVNMIGENVYAETILFKTKMSKTIAVEKLAKGVYSVILETSKGRVVKKLVIN